MPTLDENGGPNNPDLDVQKQVAKACTPRFFYDFAYEHGQTSDYIIIPRNILFHDRQIYYSHYYPLSKHTNNYAQLSL
jgi:hypothetical protein